MAQSKSGSRVISTGFHLRTNKENTSNKRKELKNEEVQKIFLLKKQSASTFLGGLFTSPNQDDQNC